MNRKAVYGIMLSLLLIGMLASISEIQTNKTVAVGIGNPKRKVKEVNLDVPKPEVLKIGVYDWLKIPECSYISILGHPSLPMRCIVIKLLLNSVVEGVEMTVQNVTLEGFYQIAPSLAPRPLNTMEDLNATSEPDLSIYESQNLYPEKWFDYRTANGLDNESHQRVTYVLIYFYPLRYLPKQETVIWGYHASATVVYKEPPEMSTPVEHLKNILITSPLLEPQALRLGRWKNETGISTRVVNTDWVYRHYPGIDRQEQIRNCIKDFVLNLGIEFVTIFGDADQVPVRYAYVPDTEAGETYVPTDLYYADLDGTWDDNLDELYADQRYDYVDGIPDVYVGRIPPSLVEYAEVAVEKIEGYQQHFDTSQSWTQRIVLAAGTGSGDGVTNPFGIAFPFLKNYIANITTDKDIVRLYESAGNLSTASLASEINKGSLFVNFAGHGNPGSWLLRWIIPIIWSESFSWSDADSLINGYKLPVVTTLSCSTARFDDEECMGERFVLNPDGGGIAYFGATRVAWGYPDEWVTTGLMGEMDWRIYGVFYEGYTKLGQMWGVPVTRYVQSHIWNYEYASVYDVKTLMEFVLLGDPTLRIYNGPETLKVPEEYATIQGAINAAYPEDTIYVEAGTYYENLVVNKTVSLLGENKNTTVIVGVVHSPVWESVISVQADDVRIANLTVTDGGHGIYLGAERSIVTDCIAHENHFGLTISSSSQNFLRRNTFFNNSYNLHILGSWNISDFVQDIDSSNHVDGRPVYYFINEENLSINPITFPDVGYLGVVNSTNVQVANLSLSGNGDGLLVAFSPSALIENVEATHNFYGMSSMCSPDTIIKNCDFSYNDLGMFLYYSGNANIIENTISHNDGGISLISSDFNVIYHNSFIENYQYGQVHVHQSDNCYWDNGYEGNYWSDYNGTDTSGDGIGDTYLPWQGVDYHPLINSYKGHNIVIVKTEMNKTVIGRGYIQKIDVEVANIGSFPQTFNVTVYANTTAIQTQTVTLAAENSTTLRFHWNTTATSYGNYTINATATTVQGETDTADNTITDDWVIVTIPGDIDGDGDVGPDDFNIFARAYGTSPLSNPNCDIDSDGDVDSHDFYIISRNYGKTDP